MLTEEIANLIYLVARNINAVSGMQLNYLRYVEVLLVTSEIGERS